eukprot:ANDGO_05270.mRNA.1 hypothetical protein
MAPHPVAIALSIFCLAVGGFFIYLAIDSTASTEWTMRAREVANSVQMLSATIWVIGAVLVIGLGSLAQKQAIL